MDHNACMELALEGERLCKRGDFHGGASYFEAAIRAGTDDLKTLSAIYSQLGNAYFFLGNYTKAMEYHQCDLTVAKTIGDRLGEAKASGNLGSTLKVLGRFDEAIFCCRRHLMISREIGDKVGEGRALYNLGNVYHVMSKHIARTGSKDPGDFPDEVKSCLQKAVKYYEENYKLMVELEDRSAQGRVCGNLGNTHYLLGNFSQAITYHEERLRIAKEFGDKAAERRAYSNLGNAHIFLGAFEIAAENYKKTLSLAQELGDRAAEAQVCYSLGNTYTLLHDYPTAIQYHLAHLAIARELHDRIGESRSYWSLGNTHSALGQYAQALCYANKHLEISREIGDHTGEITAQMSICDMKKLLEAQRNPSTSSNSLSPKNQSRRMSMEKMDLMQLSPNPKQTRHSDPVIPKAALSALETKKKEGSASQGQTPSSPLRNLVDDDKFFDLVTRFQSQRMDDQRCSLSGTENKENNQLLSNQPSSSSKLERSVGDDLFELIAGMQSRRLDEQRASLPEGSSTSLTLSNRVNNNNNNILYNNPRHRRTSGDASTLPDDDFFDMLMRCQGSRIEDQRSIMPAEISSPRPSTIQEEPSPLAPDNDDFFSLIMRLQSGRIEDQRSNPPTISSKP